MKANLRVLLVAAEAVPFAKVGGLAETAAALPKALRALGVDVRLMIPRYGTLRSEAVKTERVGEPIPVMAGAQEERVHLLRSTGLGDVPVYLLWDGNYFSAREKVYGFNDDPQRFMFFSRAVLAALRTLDWKPDVIHANDWHTAPIVAWLDTEGRKDPFYVPIATLFTIHNLAYQGDVGRLILTFGGMESLPHLPWERPGRVNWMAQGIAHADVINTVSPSYAQEILTPAHGQGLDGLLRSRRDQLFGVLNGLDVETWDPARDSALPQNFTAQTPGMRLVNKAALQREVGLPVRDDVPLLGIVSRLDEMKGLDLVLQGFDALAQAHEFQLVVLGVGDAALEDGFRTLQQRYSDRVRALIRFDERLARLIYGGADLYLMPSRFEPCGLSQMTAMRYGAIPVVRATGGLRDTVVDVDAEPLRGTGFVFDEATPAALNAALTRAFAAYQDGARWTALQQRAMQTDFSWANSARTYQDLYQRALAAHGAR